MKDKLFYCPEVNRFLSKKEDCNAYRDGHCMYLLDDTDGPNSLCDAEEINKNDTVAFLIKL